MTRQNKIHKKKVEWEIAKKVMLRYNQRADYFQIYCGRPQVKFNIDAWRK